MIIVYKDGVYVLLDSIVGDIASGTKREMTYLMWEIMKCGTELCCAGVTTWNS